MEATTHFFHYPLNFGKKVYETARADANLTKKVTDRRRDTFSNATQLITDFGAQVTIDAVFIKGQDIASVGRGTAAPAAIGDTVTDAQGLEVRIDRDGFQNILIPFAPAVTTQTETLRFVAKSSALKIVEVAYLAEAVTFDAEAKYVGLNATKLWRGRKQKTDYRGRIRVVPPLNAEPRRYACDISLLYAAEDEMPLQNFFDANTTFAFIAEYTRNPSRFFSEATLENGEVFEEYIGENKTQKRISFRILEC